MTKEIYRYRTFPDVPFEEVEAALLLALLGCEGLHGEAQVRLDAAHFLDVEKRSLVIDAGTEVGRDLNRLFVNFLRRELGETSFTVERISTRPQSEPKEVVA